MQKDIMAKTLRELLGNEYKLVSIKHHKTLIRRIDEFTTIKITNFNDIKHTVNICISKKIPQSGTWEQINFLKFAVPLMEIESVINKSLEKLAFMKETSV